MSKGIEDNHSIACQCGRTMWRTKEHPLYYVYRCPVCKRTEKRWRKQPWNRGEEPDETLQREIIDEEKNIYLFNVVEEVIENIYRDKPRDYEDFIT